MPDVIIKALLCLLAVIVCASAGCPIPVERRRDEYTCHLLDKTVCCLGSDGNDDCFISEHFPKNIEQVYISDCKIKNLSQAQFVNISHYSIKHLEIDAVTIDSIHSDPFLFLPNLTDFVLGNSRISNIPALRGALKSIQGIGSISITLKKIGINDDDVMSLFDKSLTPKIGYLNLEWNQLETLRLDIFQSWSSLHTLILSDNIISNTSSGYMRHLKVLVLNGNLLSENNVWKNIEGSLHNVTRLSLAKNAIRSLSVIDWQYLPSLKSLNLSENTIQNLNYTDLQPLNKLEILDISWNWLSNTTYNVTKHSLKTLILAHNQFSIFHPWFCLDGTSLFQQLDHLDLSYNHFQYIVAQALGCLVKLRVLDLRANPLVRIKNNTFVDLESLDTLVLADNTNGGFVSVEAAAFNNSNMQNLNLESNRLMFLRNPDVLECFTYAHNLRELNLNHNRLAGLNENALMTLLSPLKNIHKLSLAGCQLYRIPTGLLAKLSNLTTLTLNFNRFETHDLPKSFAGAVNLQNLSLTNNFIRVINNESFPSELMASLTHLNLAHNPFDCSCDNRWLFDQIKHNKASTNKLHIVSWPNKYRCRTPVKDSGRMLKDFHFDESKCDPLNGIIVVYSTIGCFIFVFIVTSTIIYKFRWYFTYWWYKMKRKHEDKKDAEQLPILRYKPPYDACSLYCLDDETIGKFLVNEFSSMMEKFGYNVFFWDRHAGVGDKVSELGDAVYGSKNAIAIITNSFLKDPWCKFQIEVALDREIELKREFLSIVVLEEVDFKLLSKFWCVRFTKTPTMRWCSVKNDVKRKALEEFIQKQIRTAESKDSTTHSSDGTRD